MAAKNTDASRYCGNVNKLLCLVRGKVPTVDNSTCYSDHRSATPSGCPHNSPATIDSTHILSPIILCYFRACCSAPWCNTAATSVVQSECNACSSCERQAADTCIMVLYLCTAHPHSGQLQAGECFSDSLSCRHWCCSAQLCLCISGAGILLHTHQWHCSCT